MVAARLQRLAAAPEALPRSAQIAAIAGAAIFLVALFIVTGFPYDRLAELLAARAGQYTGARVAIAALGPSLSLRGPELEAQGVQVTWPGGFSVALDEVEVGPGWSLAWLRGRPALRAALLGPIGSLRFTWTSGDPPQWQGSLRDVDLTRLPLGGWLAGAEVEGRVDADFDLVLADGGLRGSAYLEAWEGSITLPGFPVAVPYTTLAGELRFDERVRVEIVSLVLEGPALNAQIQGRVGAAAQAERAPLSLEVDLSTSGPALADVLRSAGLEVASDGTARIRVSGTLTRPQVR